MPGKIDPRVRDFVLAHLDSVSHLEALLLLSQSREAWTVQALAARLYIPEYKANTIARDLRRRGFVRWDPAIAAYSFDPNWDTDGLMTLLTEAHRRQLVQVTTLIHSKGSASVREFARAFQLKKDEK